MGKIRKVLVNKLLRKYGNIIKANALQIIGVYGTCCVNSVESFISYLSNSFRFDFIRLGSINLCSIQFDSVQFSSILFT